MKVEPLQETNAGPGLNTPLPTDQAIYRNLSGAALDWDLIEADLGSRAQFSGVVDVVGAEGTARAYYLNGSLRGAYRTSGQMTPCDAATLRALALSPTARLSVYAVTPVAIELSLEAARWTLLRKGAGVDVTRTWLRDMQTARTTGAIEIFAPDGRRGVVAYTHGAHTLVAFEPTIAPVMFGDAALHSIESLAERSDVQVQVFGTPETLQALEAVRPATEPVGPKASIAEPILSQPAQPAAQPAAQAVQPAPEPTAPASAAVEATPTAEAARGDSSLEAIAAAWSAVLRLTETRTDGARGAGTFDRHWRASCLELADEFLELDPFMNDVIYQHGTLTIHHGSPTLTEALTRAYLRLLVKLGVRPEALAPLLVPIHDAHRAVWREAGLEAVCRL